MAKYKFQFETGHIYDGSMEVQVRDFIAEFEGKINPSLALTIEAQGGQLIVEEPTNPEAKKREVKPVKWPEDEAMDKARQWMIRQVENDSSST